MTIRRLMTACLLLLLITTVAEASRKWEEVNRMPGVDIEQRSDLDNDAVNITVVDNFVYISIRQRTPVKIFTILGQPIVQETLQPGIYRFRLTARGIYLLKIGSTTRRITI